MRIALPSCIVSSPSRRSLPRQRSPLPTPLLASPHLTRSFGRLARMHGRVAPLNGHQLVLWIAALATHRLLHALRLILATSPFSWIAATEEPGRASFRRHIVAELLQGRLRDGPRRPLSPFRSVRTSPSPHPHRHLTSSGSCVICVHLLAVTTSQLVLRMAARGICRASARTVIVHPLNRPW